MNAAQILRVLWARRALMLKLLVGLTVLAVLVTLAMPKKHTSTADLLIDLASPDPVAGTSVNNSPIALVGYVATQVDVIRSERVARQVAERLKLADDPERVARWKRKGGEGEDFNAWVGRELLKDLQVRSAREGNVVKISYVSKSGTEAAQMANAFANVYIDTALSLRIEPAQQNAEFFQQRLRLAQQEVERARAKASGFQLANDITISDEKVDVESARLGELSQQLAKIEYELLENRSRGRSNTREGADNMSEVLESRLVQEMKSSLSELEKQLENKSVTLGSAHPEIRSLQAEVKLLRARLNAEIARYANSVRTSEVVNNQRAKELREAIALQRTKVVKLKSLRDQLAVYQNELEVAQKQYEAIAQRQTQTSVESQNKLTNVTLLTPAAAPSSGALQRLALNVAMAVLGGLGIATALALLLEARSPRVRHVDDFGDLLELPVLSVIPAPPKSARRRPPGLPWAQKPA